MLNMKWSYKYGAASVSIPYIFMKWPGAAMSPGLQKNCISASRPSARPLESWRKAWGTRLFLRNSRGVQLTPEGNVLFQHVAAAFDSLSRGEKELKRIHDFHIGQLKIGVSNTLCKYVLLPYLKSFVEKYPHVNITIESQSTAHTLEMLEARKIDIGLVAEPRARRGLNFTPVMEIHDGFVCTPAYMENLTLREGPAPDIFKTGNIMLLDRSNMSRKHLDTYLSDRDIEVNQLLEVTDMALLIEFARIGLGIACVNPGFCLRRSGKTGPSWRSRWMRRSQGGSSALPARPRTSPRP